MHATAIAMDDRGTPLASVTDDIDGQTRSNLTPDIGADEYASVSRNVGVTALLSPVDSVCGEAVTSVTVVVTNTGGFTESGFNVTTVLSGAVNTTLSQAIVGSLVSGDSDTITYSTTIDLSAGGSLTIKSYTDLAADDVHANDTLNATYFLGVPPAAPTATDVNNCGSGSVVLTATSADSILWYEDATGGTPIDSGATYTTPVLSASAIYYAAAYSLCESPRTAVNVNIYALPSIDLGNDTSINLGNTITLDAGAGFVDYTWSTGATSQTINVNATGCYTVVVTDGNGCTNSDEICVTVVLPFDVGVTEILSPVDHDCADDSIYVQIRLSNLGSSPASNIPVTIDITGSTTTTFTQTVAGPIAGTSSVVLNMGIINSVAGGTYHLLAYTGYSNDQDHVNDTTISDVTTVVAPPSPVGLGGARCGEGSVIINASSTDTIYWYDAPTGGTLLYVGDSYNIPNLTSTTSFYAQTGNYCNTQARTEVIATVHPLPTVFLGNDTTVSDSIILDAGAGFVQYVWNTSATTQTIVADSSGDYIVAVLDNFGCINSDTISLTITVGVADVELDGGISVYPNPAQNKITVDAGVAKNLIVRLIDVQGRILIATPIAESKHTFDLTGFAKGVYSLQVISGSKVSTRLVVIQ
ncbi:MAG: T9SS type A sorting domain-containing protein [Bacteroidetes bacterium]|nr:T9SS type A sorting domain-containing protein [Bacteroidota bacterium]